MPKKKLPMSNNKLMPELVFHYFDEICKIPRPSKKEGKIIAYIEEFARKHNLEYQKDDAGNLVVRKPATKGHENKQSVVLQSHLDMVCEKNSNVNHDFNNDPIQTYVDGEWLKVRAQPLALTMVLELLHS